MRLGPFRLGAPLGRGGMGEVREALHEADGLPVAIKLVRADLLDPVSIARFTHEVQTVASLDHPGVVGIFDHGSLPAESQGLPAGSPWLAMERFGGGTLGERPPVDWASLRGILLEILDTLAYTHARDVVHGDLKPANILRALATDPVRPGPSVRLVDFGLALRTREGIERAGTPTYMAPEQVDPSLGPPTAATDLYALACVAWELSTGAAPFTGPSPMQVLQAHLASPLPAFLPRFDLPLSFEAWLRRLLEKWPESRFRTAAEAAWSLSRLDAGPWQPAAIPAGPMRLGAPATVVPATVVSATVVPATEAPQTMWTAWSPTQDGLPSGRALTHAAPPVQASALPAAREVPPLPADPQAGRRFTTQLPHGAGLALFAWREHRIVGREPEQQRLWALARAVQDDGRRRVAALVGVEGVGRRRLIRWLAETLAEWGRPVVRAGEDPLASAEAIGMRPEHPLAPVTFVVEEADPEGVGPLLDLLPEDAPILLLCAGEPGRTWPPGVERIELFPLPPERWSPLLDALLPLGPALKNAVEERTTGHPGRAVRLLGELVARGLVAGPDGFELPPGGVLPALDIDLAHAADRALARCRGPAERLALAVAVALGEEGGPVCAQAIQLATAEAGLDPPQGPPWTEVLAREGLVLRRRDGMYLPAEAAEAILSRPGVDRERVHRACLAAWEGSALLAQRRKGMGEQLLALGQPAEALAHLHWAATWLLGAHQYRAALRVMEDWQRAMEEAALPGEDPRWMYGQVRLAYAFYQVGDIDQGERFGRLALAHAERHLPPHDRIWPLSHVAMILQTHHGDLAGAEALAWSVSPEGLPPIDRLTLLLARARVRGAQRRHVEALQILTPGVEALDAHPLRRSEVCGAAAGHALVLGRVEAGLGLVDLAARLREEAGIGQPPVLDLLRAEARLLSGAAEEARALADRALALASRSGDTGTRIHGLRVLACALCALDRPVEALHTLRPASALARRLRRQADLAAITTAIALAGRQAGEQDATRLRVAHETLSQRPVADPLLVALLDRVAPPPDLAGLRALLLPLS